MMQAQFTKSDYELLPEGFPAQLIGGQLIRDAAPSYGHEVIRSRLARVLFALVPDGLVLLAPVDVLVDGFNIFQPDVVVLAEAPPSLDAQYVGTPRVVFEILSPRTARHDRHEKMPKLLALGVHEVWLIDPASSRIECHTSQGVRVSARGEHLSSNVIEGLVLRPEGIFAPVAPGTA